MQKSIRLNQYCYISIIFACYFFISCENGEKHSQSIKYISYVELVNRLTDLKSLSVLPEEGEKSEMWSSYDRKSRVDSITGEFIDWSANNDGLSPQYIRKEGNNEVLAEMDGPGAIVRIWSASPKKGKVYIYIDGNEKPILSESFIDYFKPTVPAFAFPNLVYETNAKGFNNYVPITYQKSCKIVAEPGWGQYFHFNYITFKPKTKIEPFNANLTETGLKALASVDDFFGKKLGQNPNDGNLDKIIKEVSINSGVKTTVYEFEDSGAIGSLKVRVKNVPKEREDEILRKTILEISWDDENEPSVWSPLGDFFGSAPGCNEYKTLPMGMTKNWMYSYWYMPFKNGAKIKLHNLSDIPITVTMEIGKEELKGDIDNLGRFHAKWHRDLEPVDEERWPDWLMLKTNGSGRFLGASLSVWNPKGGSNTKAKEGHYWWGEGDEKFFVDGETFPSTFGTGTEDYFGYAWCNPSLFNQAFHSQTIDSDNMGHQAVNRWQVIDNIPFQKTFDGYMEKYFANDWPTQYAMVVYWYLDAEGKDPIKATPTDEVYGFEIPYKVFRKPDVLEAENLNITSNSGGWATIDAFAHESLYKSVSGHKILFWTAQRNKKNILETEFTSQRTGLFEVYANIIKQPEGGKFNIQINGKRMRTINFQSSDSTYATEIIKIGKIKLNKGIQSIQFKTANNHKFPQKMWIDYFEFRGK
ncbi:hypothetical protein HME9304_01956 [Flagellimonas maritima]|uniref:DUF2961 domain-containing protein n=1 Tax=Flagellimonas maritima TaxID=1383885 RepID=A0A2Z4LTD8_9FLAO|nr:DUF2961 domain-containing protein [Allomuricauda aurantiaca]AWX44950.1 hypothetical protein HME9304_01956 [Allomuricauda aurantiaca]